MRAIGYCDISIKREPVLTSDTFKVLFESYCNSWGHTSEEIFVSGSHIEDSNDTLQQVDELVANNAGNVDESLRSLRYTLDTVSR